MNFKTVFLPQRLFKLKSHLGTRNAEMNGAWVKHVLITWGQDHVTVLTSTGAFSMDGRQNQ